MQSHHHHCPVNFAFWIILLAPKRLVQPLLEFNFHKNKQKTEVEMIELPDLVSTVGVRRGWIVFKMALQLLRIWGLSRLIGNGKME